MGSPDQLIEINREHLPLLRDLYKPNTLRNYIAYMTIDIYVRLFEREPHIKQIQFYCLNGDFSNGTFIVTVSDHINVMVVAINKNLLCLNL